MTDEQQQIVAEITREARTRCEAIGEGALAAVEELCAELEKTPTLGRRARSASSDIEIYTTRLEGTGTRPALTVTYVYDAPPSRARPDSASRSCRPYVSAGGGTGF